MQLSPIDWRWDIATSRLFIGVIELISKVDVTAGAAVYYNNFWFQCPNPIALQSNWAL
jgi:hypothetical protein